MQDTTGQGLGRQTVKFFDWSTFLTTILLLTAGFISIYSATYIYSTAYGSGMSQTFVRQVMAGGVGLVAMTLIIFIPERFINSWAYTLYGIGILLLVLVLIFGKTTYGTKGWINIGGFTIQPSELAKIGVMLAIAKHLSRKGTDIRNLRDFGIVTGFVALPVILIALQPDIGSSLVYIALLMGMLFWAGFDTFILYFLVCLPVIIFMALVGELYLTISVVVFSVIALLFRRKILITVIVIGMFLVSGLASPIIYNNMKPHQQARIQSFINPDSDPLGKGYNVNQSKLAVGSGGLTGKGFLQGTQTQLRYIPKQWTDFIFSVPTEEFGFLGGVAVIILLISLILRGVSIASETDSYFSSVLAFGIAVVLLYHTFINIGMAIGLMPVMGIPLPFMSAGGTSLVANLIMVGILLNIFRHKRMKR